MTRTYGTVGAPRGTTNFESTTASLRRAGLRAGVLAAGLIVAGCSLPSMGGLFGGDEETVDDPTVARAETTEAADDVPGQDAAYPNLATVPDRDSVRSSGKLDRAKIAEGLVADRRNAQYTEQIVRRDGTLARAPRARPAPTASTEPRTTAVLGAASKPSAVPSPPSMTPAEEAPAVTSGGAPTAEAPPVPAVPATPVQTADIAPVPVPPPAPPAPAADVAPPPPAPPPEATLLGRPAILPPPPPPATPAPTPSAAAPSAAASNGAGRADSAEATPVGPLAGPPPPPPELAPPRPAAVAPAMPPPARTQLASASVPPEPSVPGDQVGTILFDHGSARLAAEDKHLLRQIAGLYRTHGGTIRVVGHASGRTREANPVRHQMINFEVSMRRANAVAAELRRHGVPAESIVVEAKSNGEPKFQETMPSGEAGNRRADIFLDN